MGWDFVLTEAGGFAILAQKNSESRWAVGAGDFPQLFAVPPFPVPQVHDAGGAGIAFCSAREGRRAINEARLYCFFNLQILIEFVFVSFYKCKTCITAL